MTTTLQDHVQKHGMFQASAGPEKHVFDGLNPFTTATVLQFIQM